MKDFNYANWRDIAIEETNEAVIELKNDLSSLILTKPIYYIDNVPGATKAIYLRKGVINRLLDATKLLPKGYKFLVYDGLRSYETQMSLYEDFYRKVHENLGRLNDVDIEKYVSLPSRDLEAPSPHLTGGSVDLTIVNEKGKPLDMGTDFDFFGDASRIDFYETTILSNECNEIRNNRRLLYDIMIEAGFTNFSSEWWHYDYGNQFYAKAMKTIAIYGFVEVGDEKKIR